MRTERHAPHSRRALAHTKVAAWAIAGMVMIAGGIIVVVLTRDSRPPEAVAQGERPITDQTTVTSQADVAPLKTPPSPQQDDNPQTEQVPENAEAVDAQAETVPSCADALGLGYAISDVDLFFSHATGWKWITKSEGLTTFAHIAINESWPDVSFMVAGCAENDTVHGISAFVALTDQQTNEDFSRNLLLVGIFMGQFSMWEGPDVIEWLGLVASEHAAGRLDLTSEQEIYFNSHCLSASVIGAVLFINLMASDATTAAEGPQWPKDAPKRRERIEVGEIETKTVEVDEAWHKISYIVHVRNNTWSIIKDATMEIQFMDADGFVLDEQMDYPVVLQPGENTLRGLILLATRLARQWTSVEVRVTADQL